MTINYPEYYARRAREEEQAALCKDHVCGECGAGLIHPVDRETGEERAICAADREHRGLERIHSAYELYRQGAPMDVAIENAIERARRKRGQPVRSRLAPTELPRSEIPPMTEETRKRADREMDELFG